jgi:hypothetical protein
LSKKHRLKGEVFHSRDLKRVKNREMEISAAKGQKKPERLKNINAIKRLPK